MTSLFNLEWTIKAIKALQEEGVEALVLKGPIQSNLVYHRWDVGRSCDIDLLVRPEHFAGAGQALSAHGFAPLLDDSDRWWADHLGEAPYRNADANSPMVDLHHRVQQPGGPFPRHPERFFADSTTARYGTVDVSVLSKEHGALLAAISYGKALGEGAPWMHYAHELMTLYEGLSCKGRDYLRELSAFHGMKRLLDDALFASRLLFAVPDPANTELSRARRERLIESACGVRRKQRLFRSRKLWAWTDGSPPTRLVEFGRGLLRVWQSEMARISQEKSSEQSAGGAA